MCEKTSAASRIMSEFGNKFSGMKKLFALTFIILGATAWQLSAVEVPSREAVLQMIANEQFAQLEKLTSDLRAQKLEFYRGYSKLSIVYGYLLGFSNDTDDSEWEDFIVKLQAWADAYPQSPTPRIALGNFYASWAWKARGGGYADTVTDEGWRLMKQRLEKAREYLEAAENLSVKDPEVYNALLRVALGQGWDKDEMNTVFQKGIELDPNYQQLYESKAYFLLPRWYGKPGEWEAFAEAAANTRGGDEGDILYMSIARSQAWSEQADFFKNTSISYERMQRGFEAAIQRNPDYLWDVSSYCYFACVADDRDTAKKLFQKIDGHWEKEVWGSENNFKQWEQWALQSGNRPSMPSSTRTVVSPKRLGSIAIIIVSIWVGLLTIIGAIVWLVVRKSKKS
jgi:hypothetical protein